MSITRNPYPKYKYSSTQWFGDIPSHWSVSKLKYKVSCNDSTLPEYFDCSEVIKYVEISDVTYENGITSFTELKFQDAPSRARRITQKNDVIISTVRTYLKAIAKIDSDDLIVSTGFAVLRPRDIDSSYLYYVLSTSGFLREVENHSTGVSYPAITANELLNLEIPLPTPYEQKKVAEYLDDVTGKVDALIMEKKRQVDDLRKYRTSLITETVTHGLNTDVAFKDSGIDWCEKIPVHWLKSRLKYIGEARNGLTYTPEDICDKDDGVLVLRSSNIQNDKLCFEDNIFVRKNVGELMMLEGDILICSRNGSASLIGKSAIIPKGLCATFGAFMMRFRSNINNRYTLYLVRMALANNKSLYTTSTINQLTNSVVGNIQIPLPPKNEQEEIASYLDDKTEKIDKLIGELDKQLEDLALYKKAVITEAVTGKVDVRDWTPKK